ncbi:hypothetical protein MJD09_23065 [bacterium]|nr:hypothetical protein [bacterium]
MLLRVISGYLRRKLLEFEDERGLLLKEYGGAIFVAGSASGEIHEGQR